jgi:hypothetical protein
MAQASDALGFAWANYPQHRMLIALRRKQSKRLTKCSVCQRRPVIRQTVLVHVALRGIETPTLDPKRLIRSLALCKVHDGWTDDELGAWAWPDWKGGERG